MKVELQCFVGDEGGEGGDYEDARSSRRGGEGSREGALRREKEEAEVKRFAAVLVGVGESW